MPRKYFIYEDARSAEFPGAFLNREVSTSPEELVALLDEREEPAKLDREEIEAQYRVRESNLVSIFSLAAKFLSEKQFRSFFLAFGLNLSLEERAKQLGVTNAQAAVQLNHALNRIRTVIKRLMDGNRCFRYGSQETTLTVNLHPTLQATAKRRLGKTILSRGYRKHGQRSRHKQTRSGRPSKSCS
jgi:predicted DNA-binding protein YlxM (UPF0122 family)